MILKMLMWGTFWVITQVLFGILLELDEIYYEVKERLEEEKASRIPLVKFQKCTKLEVVIIIAVVADYIKRN